jgi:2-haloalkanoic acid dehalogenase type II
VAEIRVLACDVFGTTVDWYTGVATQLSSAFSELDVSVDAGAFANEWRAEYVPSMQRVRDGQREWANLDVLHAESLDLLLRRHGLADAVSPAARAMMVRAWHRLPAWDDTLPGLERLRTRYVTATLSNGGFALLTHPRAQCPGACKESFQAVSGKEGLPAGALLRISTASAQLHLQRRGLARAASISSRRRFTSASNALAGSLRWSVNLMPPLVDSKPSTSAMTLSTTAGLNGNTE